MTLMKVKMFENEENEVYSITQYFGEGKGYSELGLICIGNTIINPKEIIMINLPVKPMKDEVKEKLKTTVEIKEHKPDFFEPIYHNTMEKIITRQELDLYQVSFYNAVNCFSVTFKHLENAEDFVVLLSKFK